MDPIDPSTHPSAGGRPGGDDAVSAALPGSVTDLALGPVLDAIDAAVWIVDRTSTVLACNAAAAARRSPSVPDSESASLRAYFDSAASGQISAWMVEVQRTGRAQTFYLEDDWPRTRLDLTPIGVGGVGQASERGHCLLVARESASQRQSQRHVRDLLDGVRLIAVMLDTRGTVTFANPFLAELTGRPLAEIEGANWFDVFLPEAVRTTVRSMFESTIASGELPRDYENDIVTVHGERRTIRWSNTILYDEANRAVGVASLGEDITERLREQEALLRSRERLRALATQLSVVEDRERRRFATVLHDELSQELLVLRLKLTSLLADAGEDMRPGLEDLQARLGETIERARLLTYDLSPPVLYELGLEPALESVGERIASEHGLDFEFVVRGSSEPLVDDLSPVFFRAVRELLMNVVKHADATRVRVEIRRDFPFVAVVVEDDGRGFEPGWERAGESALGGFGLFSIRERLRQLGGTLEIGASSMGGAVVIVTCPLAPRRSASDAEG